MKKSGPSCWSGEEKRVFLDNFLLIGGAHGPPSTYLNIT